ncbi:MAG: hypothetical protein ACI89J_001907 [Hyphomicrobiaceae bacterium]|jgi:uncharacterized protein YjiS (DUF1127 family)
MSTIRSRNSAIYGLFDNLLRGAAFGLAVLKRIHEARRSRAITQLLLTHDDRMLNDIGVSRSDVEQALSVRWDVDPATMLAEIRRRRMQAERQGLIQWRVH